MAAVTMTVLR